MNHFRAFVALVLTVVLIAQSHLFVSTAVADTQSYSNQISHPVGSYSEFLESWKRGILSETITAKKQAVDAESTMTIANFKAYINGQRPTNKFSRPAYELSLARLSQIYNIDTINNKDYGEKVLHGLMISANNFETIRNTAPPDTFSQVQYFIPNYLVLAYDQVYNFPQSEYDRLSIEYGKDVRETIEKYFKETARDFYNLLDGKHNNNMVGYGLKQLSGVGLVLNDPEVIRWAIAITDSIYDEHAWHGDGMWYEGTVDYLSQLKGNADEALRIVKNFTDPPNTIDTVFTPPLTLSKPNNFLNTRWPMASSAANVIPLMQYPNGQKISIHDVDSNPIVDPNKPIIASKLNNVVLNHFGFYTLTHGTTSGAQTASLLFPPVAAGGMYGGGHYHENFLSTTFWAGGVEMLADAGYPRDSATRFFHSNALAHNVGLISVNGAEMSQNRYLYNRPSVLAYDDGTTSDKKIQLIEASLPMPTSENIQLKRRMLMTVELDTTHSYTLDIQRMKGGTVHENILRSSEDENVNATTTLDTTAEANSLSDYLTQQNLPGRMSKTVQNVKFTNAKIATNAQTDFAFSWKGQTSASTFNAFIKGNTNTLAAFSTFPSMRRAGGVANQFYMRRGVTPNDVTKFAGVYEGTKNSESPKVSQVSWVSFDDNQVAELAIIESQEYKDFIYSSDDMVERPVTTSEGLLSFSGSVGFARFDKAQKRFTTKYLYGDGSIKKDGFILLQGEPDFQSEIEHVERSLNGENWIYLSDSPENVTTKGVSLIQFPYDQSGIAHKIMGTNTSTKAIKLHNDVGFEKSSGGKMTPIYFPTKINVLAGNTLNPETYAVKTKDMPNRNLGDNAIVTVKTPKFDNTPESTAIINIESSLGGRIVN